ncbi:unnamed protein product, partial [Darwinula stevensoni]
MFEDEARAGLATSAMEEGEDGAISHDDEEEIITKPKGSLGSASPAAEVEPDTAERGLMSSGEESGREDSPLDFSVKKEGSGSREAPTPPSPLNLKRQNSRSSPVATTGPLDLSVPRKRPSSNDLGLRAGRAKQVRPTANASPPAPSALESMKALERMQELTRLSGPAQVSQLFGQLGAWHSPWLGAAAAAAAAAVSSSTRVPPSMPPTSSASPVDPLTRDIMRCVWCRQSFSTLAELSTHMREAKHCG